MKARPSPSAKRSFGQNFLSDQNFINRIIEAVDPTSDDTVIEIGAGRGALTEKLVDKAGRFVAIELDRDLQPVLEQRFAGRTNFELISRDALRLDFSLFKSKDGPRLKLVANLPYYISTAILQHLIASRRDFSQMVLMFQREVVERITAKPGSSERGYLTVIVEAFFSVQKLFDVPPTAFRPVPKVWSSVVRLTPKDDDSIPSNREQQFEKLVSAAFRQKRKTVLNNLRSAGDELGIAGRVESMLLDCMIDPRRRSETLTFDEWKRLLGQIVHP